TSPAGYAAAVPAPSDAADAARGALGTPGMGGPAGRVVVVGVAQVQLSLLDRSRTRAGEPDAVALRHTVERAQHAERLGYHRFWVAEHHAVPGIASGSPPVLIAAIAARTERIRVGSEIGRAHV